MEISAEMPLRAITNRFNSEPNNRSESPVKLIEAATCPPLLKMGTAMLARPTFTSWLLRA